MKDQENGPIWRTPTGVKPATGVGQKPSTENSASILPLLVLHRQAWDLAQADGVLLERLEHAVEALALSRAIAALVEEAVGGSAGLRWAVKVSEAEHLLMVVRDALMHSDEERV